MCRSTAPKSARLSRTLYGEGSAGAAIPGQQVVDVVAIDLAHFAEDGVGIAARRLQSRAMIGGEAAISELAVGELVDDEAGLGRAGLNRRVILIDQRSQL